MRMTRELQLIPDHENRAGIYHVTSRAVWKSFILNSKEKEFLRQTMRNYETFCGVRVLTFCIMSNHFHILVEVPPKQEAERLIYLQDGEFYTRLYAIYSDSFVNELRCGIDKLRSDALKVEAKVDLSENELSPTELAEQTIREIKRQYTRRMCDLSGFMKAVKQRFTQWYNSENNSKGTVWEGRFKSELVESGYAAQTVAAYIDLNPLRAGIVADPKDYRWCGYAEAIASKKEAQLGLLSVMQGLEKVSPNAELLGKLSHEWESVMDEYRMVLAIDGVALNQDVTPIQGESKTARAKKSKGFSREASEQIIATGGKLTRAEILRCRVRYFSDGVVLGSKAFVNQFFNRLKAVVESEEGAENRFKKRETGARKVQKLKGEPLYSMRSLQVDDVS